MTGLYPAFFRIQMYFRIMTLPRIDADPNSVNAQVRFLTGDSRIGYKLDVRIPEVAGNIRTIVEWVFEGEVLKSDSHTFEGNEVYKEFEFIYTESAKSINEIDYGKNYSIAEGHLKSKELAAKMVIRIKKVSV